jgi:broad specificity phosphatase PhoE
MTVELIFETHALTTDNEAGIATGWRPGALSPRGRELARALGERHRHREVAAVFVSELAAQRSRHIDRPWPGGQSYRQVVAQVGEFLGDLRAGWDGRTVVLIGHSATKWALDCLLDGAALEDLVDAPFGWREGWRYQLPTA